MINNIKYLQYEWVGYQQWSRLSFGTFGSSAGGACTKTFKMKNHYNLKEIKLHKKI